MAVKRITDIVPKLEISDYWEGPFDEALAAMKAGMFSPVTLEQNIKLRLTEAKHQIVEAKQPNAWESIPVFSRGNAVSECFVVVPFEGDRFVFITKIPLIIENSVDATNCHRRGHEYPLTKEQVSRALKEHVPIPRREHDTFTVIDDELNTIVIDPFANSYVFEHGNFYIKSPHLGKEYISTYLFGPHAAAYGDLLAYIGITRIQIGAVSFPSCRDAEGKEMPYARSVWLGDLGMSSSITYRCGLGGLKWDADCNTRLRGYLDLAAKAKQLKPAKAAGA